MVTTPHRSWAGCREFGLRDFFEQSIARPELPQAAVDAVNLALSELGLSKYLVESIASETSASNGVVSYAVKLAPADQSSPAVVSRL